MPAGLRLVDDPLAAGMLTGGRAVLGRTAVGRRAFALLLDRSAPGVFGGIICRTRVFDDACSEALAAGVEQVVILGAGMDTRPYRLPGMRAARIWELDLPETQAVKRAAITRACGRLPENVRYAPADLTAEPLADLLGRLGVRTSLPTLLLAEGVLPYLPRATTEETFAYAGGLAPGSRLVFSYLQQDVLNSDRYAERAKQFSWQTGLPPEQLAALLAAHHLELVRDLAAEDYQTLYLRPRGRTLEVFDLERTAVAQIP
jgi:methyltransferase (TIGR00027 family)